MALIFFIFRFLLALLSGLIRLRARSHRSLTPFECGFNRVGPVCTSFRLHSYTILLVFVVFDLELCILLGFLLGSGLSLWLFFIYMFFIFLTYYIEVVRGSLSWTF